MSSARPGIFVSDQNHLSLNEAAFLRQAIREGRRADGRALYDYRNVRLRLGSQAAGECDVSIGNTRVVGRMSCSLAAPFPDRPTEGFFAFHVDPSPLALPESQLSISPVELQRVIERGLRESRALDVESLCVVAGECVWALRLVLRIIEDCGNLLDCCSLAALASLFHFRRPDITIGERVVVHKPSEKPPVALSLHHMPLCVTFGLLASEQQDRSVAPILLVDPTHLEEQVLSGRLTLILNVHREICGIHKPGGLPIPPRLILTAAKIGAVKVKELTAILQDELKSAGRKEDLPLGQGLSVPMEPPQDGTAFVTFHHGKKKLATSQKADLNPSLAQAEQDAREFLERLLAEQPILFEEDEEGKYIESNEIVKKELEMLDKMDEDEEDEEEEEQEEMLQDEFK